MEGVSARNRAEEEFRPEQVETLPALEGAILCPRDAFPVVDLFAGPGGLGEGFAALASDKGKSRFHSVAAIEREEFAHQTLLLRHFLRCFREGEGLGDYHSYLRGEIDRASLFARHPAEHLAARQTALKIALGPDNHHRVRRLIDERLSGRTRWALVGGPPCQAYSLVGRSRMMGLPGFEQDERHFLYKEYLKIIVDHRPPVFVMENVKGLLSAKVDGTPVINRIISDLSRPKEALGSQANGLGYKLYSLSEQDQADEEVDPRLFLVRAERYGLPQARHRMFIVGIRNDLKVRPRQLRPHDGPTVRETIGDLPALRSSLSRGRDTPDKWRDELARLAAIDLRGQLNVSHYAASVANSIRLRLDAIATAPEERLSRSYPESAPSNHRALNDIRVEGLPVLTGHEARSHMASDLRRYLYAAVFADVTGRSPKLADFPRALLPDHKNVERGCSGEMFSDRFRVQTPDAVSTTVTSHISKDGHYFIHYDPLQCRSLTVREAARLQTFPDDYKFEGPRTAQYHQVGNAVPPYLAKQIAEIVAEILDAIREPQ